MHTERFPFAFTALVLGVALSFVQTVRAQDAAPADVSPAPTAIARPASDTGLYEAFGGEAGIARMTADFLANLLADPRTSPYFAKVSVKRFLAKAAEHFCAQLGGPCTYTGSSMKGVHSYLKIDRAAFNAVVEDLQDAMNKNRVPHRAQNALLARLAPMHRDIETR